MKKIIRLFSVLSVLGAFCAPVHAYTNRDTAVLRVMNKAAGKTQTLRAPIDSVVNYEKLSIVVRTCKQTDPFEAEDYFAFIEVSKSSEDKIFSGWMSRNEPGENPLQNADYDLWVVSCE